MLEWVLQTCGGIVLLITTGLAAFALKEIFRLRSDHSALEARVLAQNDAVQQRLSGIEGWLQNLDKKIDSLLER